MGAYFDSDATPLNILIDVRTMKIVLVTMGYSTTAAYWAHGASDARKAVMPRRCLAPSRALRSRCSDASQPVLLRARALP